MDATTITNLVSLQLASGLLAILFLTLVLCLLIETFKPSKSKKYRELLTDLYIAGKVRIFAEEDKVDLDLEKVNFERWNKKQLLRDKGLDRTIEENLKEKVIEDSLKKLDKAKK